MIDEVFADGAPIDFDVQQTGGALNMRLAQVDFLPTRNSNDIAGFVDQVEPRVREQLRRLLAVHHGLKYMYELTVQYVKKADVGDALVPGTLNCKFLPLYNDADIDDTLQAVRAVLLTRNARFLREESGMVLASIGRARIIASRFTPLAAGCHFKLPPFLANKKCIVNSDNTDDRCFAFAVAAAIHHSDPAVRNHLVRRGVFQRYFERLHLNDLQYPVSPAEVQSGRVEDVLKLRINVFSYFDAAGHARHPMYVSKKTQYAQEVDLLYMHEGDNAHWAAITSFPAFVRDVAAKTHTKLWCKRCFYHTQYVVPA